MDSLRIFGTDYSDVAGIKSTNTDGVVLDFYSTNTLATRIASQQIQNLVIENSGEDLRGYAFNGLTGLQSVYAPNLTGTDGTGYCFNGCTGLKTINFPKATGFGNRCFAGCTGLTTVVLPSGIHCWAYNFSGCTNLTAIDYAGTLGTQGTFDANGFNGSSKLSVLIIRNSVAAKLNNISCFTNTPFASGKAGGTLYVPQALISTYQAATNWSTILGYSTNQILPIEGSIYETQYADGTAIS